MPNDLTRPSTAVLDVLDAIARAYHAKDAAAAAALYEADATVADLAPPLARRGLDAAKLRTWFDGWDGPVALSYRDIETAIAGDLAVCGGLVRTEVRTPAGDLVGWWSRITYALRRGPAGWRIFHEHNSVPFHMDGSFRAATDLEP